MQKVFSLPFLVIPVRSSERWAEASLAAGAVLRDRRSKERWKGAKLAGDAVGTKAIFTPERSSCLTSTGEIGTDCDESQRPLATVEAVAVLDPSKQCSVPPKLKDMKNQEAAVGQKLVLRCETTSEYPALRFKWLKNGKEITKKNKPENIKIPKKQKKYSELHIYRATLADAGEYACRVSSKLGNDSTKASVIITDTN
ncbi:PREDICTED: pro-neuregulin-1, membrane-bound isoform-like, partial [Fulmarus glacialis]|uniref:pro-neuregulin-1, membrane-bound isoform-like n=1 Tax=Fulmarus glacialis TaxID=30455 RepID=UPI00051BCE16